MEIKIYTTDPKTIQWRSLDEKLETIKNALNEMPGADFSISIEYKNTIPEVDSVGRITHAYMDKLRAGTYYDFVVLHMSKLQQEQFGVKSSLRGARQSDRDDVGEMYVMSDEHTKRGKGKTNQFIETTLHEMRHEINAGCGRKDDTHDIHNDRTSLIGTFGMIDFTTYRPVRQAQKKVLVSALKNLIRSLRRKLN